MEKSKNQPGAYALRLLAIRDRSRQEIRQKLTAKKYPPGEVEDTLRHLARKGFLNDSQYAWKIARYLSQERMLGARRIIQKLIQKGIAEDLIGEVVDQAERDFPSSQRVRKLLQAKLKNRTPAGLSPQEFRKLGRFLYQRGFSWGDIQDAFEEVGGLIEE